MPRCSHVHASMFKTLRTVTVLYTGKIKTKEYLLLFSTLSDSNRFHAQSEDKYRLIRARNKPQNAAVISTAHADVSTCVNVLHQERQDGQTHCAAGKGCRRIQLHEQETFQP